MSDIWDQCNLGQFPGVKLALPLVMRVGLDKKGLDVRCGICGFCFLSLSLPKLIYNRITAMGFWQYLPFTWTALKGKNCWHPIAVNGVVDTFSSCHGKVNKWHLFLFKKRYYEKRSSLEWNMVMFLLKW